MDKKQLKHLIDVAAGREPADLCVTNCHVVDVFNKNVFESNVYIVDGLIASLEHKGLKAAKQTIDAGGRYMVPGFIDSHLHIESSHVSPAEFSRLVGPCGLYLAGIKKLFPSQLRDNGSISLSFNCRGSVKTRPSPSLFAVSTR